MDIAGRLPGHIEKTAITEYGKAVLDKGISRI
ncbi:hypothetical protein SPV1_09323 [Mariprofundus ferrooxydans PV-1]|uniref:Uncharacterized protein n=1 Tax=Mariprofundus ferrooxydans PV-1 TaxID=314345 RepID=Q0F000_9PROT|nr:hypothetical protein SPV1_09323 [Mariprofundus ferrooxydans PV-1]